MAVFEFSTTIRYTEVDSYYNLTMVALLDLFQDCSTFQSESLGLGVTYLKEIRRAWVLSSWHVIVNKMPKLGDKVTVKTWSHGIKYTLGFRNFVLCDEGDNILCCADTIWAYIDIDTLSPVRCPAEVMDLYGVEPALEMKAVSRKIEVPAVLNKEDDFDCKFYFIDTNNHMNNSKYVLCALEYLPSDFNASELRVEYKKSALLHDTIHPFTSYEENTFTVVMKDDDGNIYSIIQFIK